MLVANGASPMGEVIIVDDHRQFADMLALQLGSVGLITQVYYSASEFLQHRLSAEDVVILDLMMPGMDGIELLRVLKQRDCQAGLILVSGQDQGVMRAAEDLARAQDLAYLSSFSKPFKLSELTRFIQTLDRSTPILVADAHQPQWQPSATELLKAINENQLLLHYQPQFDLQREKLVGVEALVRWNHPVHGMVSPGMFITLAEEQGLIAPLTERVIQLAITQLAQWQHLGLDTRVSINVSASNVHQFDLPEKVSRLLALNRLQPQQLVLEVTETALMTELVASLDVLTRMRIKGFQLSIDDFGTGYSSLSQLHKIPFTELKIDRSFVQNLLSDSDSLGIVETCIMLGHKLKMQVVAEGIEDQACLDKLTQLGCDIGQGFFLAKPMPGSEIRSWLQQRSQYSELVQHREERLCGRI